MLDRNNRIDITDVLSFANEIVDKIETERIKMGHFNIIITGKTGVGKSTLINAVFRKRLADVGIGTPVTSRTKLIESPDVPLRIYDTKGLELGYEDREEVKAEISDLITQKQHTLDPDQFIHAIWYCISAVSDRIEEEEINWIKELATHIDREVPVIIVLSKTYVKKNARAMKAEIEKMSLPVHGIVPVLAESMIDQDEEDDEPRVMQEAFGLVELIDLTLEVIPENAQKALINAQKVNIDLKVSRARKWLAGFSATNFGVGFTPLPFADTPILIGTEVTMLAKITSIFGIEMDKAMITAIASAIVGCGGAALGGRMIVSNLLKLIPGVGWAVGGAISGATAAALTAALGEAYIIIMKKIAKGEINKDAISQKEMIEEMKKLFKEQLSGRR